jgi:hypothetical protein
MSPRKFAELRAELSPEAQARAQRRAIGELLRAAYGELVEALYYVPMPGQTLDADGRVANPPVLSTNHQRFNDALHQMHVATHEAATALSGGAPPPQEKK